MVSVYQSKEWAKVCSEGRGWNSHHIGKNIFFTFEKIFPIIGKKKVLFAEGIEKLEKTSLEELNNLEKILKPLFTIISTTFYKEPEIIKKELYKFSNYTIVLDLKQSEEQLWKNLEKKSIRWGVKKAIKEGINITPVSTKKELRDFYKIYLKTCSKGGFSAESFKFFELINDIMVPKKLASIFIAKKFKKVVSGAIVLNSKDYSVLNLSGTNELGQKTQANLLIYWELIRLLKKSGKRFFDLGGYDKEAKKGKKTYNINKFKERFGGEIVEQSVYSTNWKYPFLRRVFKYYKRTF